MEDAVMRLPADATLEHAAALAQSLPLALSGAQGRLRLDASALTALDTSTIALLMQARRLAQAAGRTFEVVGAPPRLATLARLYGVEDLLLLST